MFAYAVINLYQGLNIRTQTFMCMHKPYRTLMTQIELIHADKISVIIFPHQYCLCFIYPVTTKTIKDGLGFATREKIMFNSSICEINTGNKF